MLEWRIEEQPIDSINWRGLVRSDAGDLATLAESLRAHGVLQPLLAHREGPDIVGDDGWRRWQAAQLVGITALPVIVTHRALTRAEAIEIQLVTALQRKGLNPIEKARGIDELMQAAGCSAAKAANRIGVSAPMASKLLTLRLLSPELQRKVEEGTLALSTAYAIAKVADPAERDHLAREAVSGFLTRDRATERSKALKRRTSKPPQPRRPRLPRVVLPLGMGASVIVTAADLSLGAVVNLIGNLFHTMTGAHSGGFALADVVKQLSDSGGAACQHSLSG